LHLCIGIFYMLQPVNRPWACAVFELMGSNHRAKYLYTLQAIFAGTYMLLGPLLVLGGKFGRRKCWLLSRSALLMLGFNLCLFCRRFFWIGIIEFVWALLPALMSGADLALLYDSEARRKLTRRWTQAQASPPNIHPKAFSGLAQGHYSEAGALGPMVVWCDFYLHKEPALAWVLFD